MRATLVDVQPDPELLAHLLEGLVRYNVVAMRRSPLPRLYSSRVRYVPEASGLEEWRPAHTVFRLREGDCEDLAGVRAAELRLEGDQLAAVVPVRTGPHTIHIYVRRGDGQLEDPSAMLGMALPGAGRFYAPLYTR